jgi:hypothetical protein
LTMCQRSRKAFDIRKVSRNLVRVGGHTDYLQLRRQPESVRTQWTKGWLTGPPEARMKAKHDE